MWVEFTKVPFAIGFNEMLALVYSPGLVYPLVKVSMMKSLLCSHSAYLVSRSDATTDPELGHATMSKLPTIDPVKETPPYPEPFEGMI